MIPVLLASVLVDEEVLEGGPHADDSVSHELDLLEPLVVESLVGEDGACDPCAVDRWVGVEGSDEDLELRVDLGLLFWRGGNDGESADSLAVKTHVLRAGEVGQGKLTVSQSRN